MGTLKKTDPSPYFAWVNYAKGLGIILVVVGHAILALNNTKAFENSVWIEPMQYFADWIYVFHMPLFFILSGFFIQQSVSKGSKPFFTRKLQTIVYPYFLWSILQTLIQILFPLGSRNQLTLSDLISIYYKPVLQFWFLYCLFFLMVLYYLFYLVFKKYTPIYYLLFAIVCIGLLIASVNLGEWGVLYQVRYYITYFALGAVIMFYRPNMCVENFLHKIFTKQNYLIFNACLGFFLIGLGIKFKVIEGGLEAQNIPFALLGILATISLSLILVKIERNDKTYVISLINQLGNFSLEIYVAHSIFMAAMRGVIVKIFKIDDYLFVFFVINIVGLYVPILIATWCKKYKVGYIFKFSN